MRINKYSEDAERNYYKSSPVDRRSLNYEHLDKYVSGSVGIDFFSDKRVLDIGAGEGVYSAWIADQDKGGASEVVGIELIEHRIRHEYTHHLTNLRFIEGNIFEMEPARNAFDIVFMNLVLHHLRFKLMDTFQYVVDTLKPGGQFLAFEPNIYSPIAAVLHILHSRSKNEGFLSPRQVRHVMKQYGFKDIKVGYFWRNKQWAKNPLLASCFWIKGTK